LPRICIERGQADESRRAQPYTHYRLGPRVLHCIWRRSGISHRGTSSRIRQARSPGSLVAENQQPSWLCLHFVSRPRASPPNRRQSCRGFQRLLVEWLVQVFEVRRLGGAPRRKYPSTASFCQRQAHTPPAVPAVPFSSLKLHPSSSGDQDWASPVHPNSSRLASLPALEVPRLLACAMTGRRPDGGVPAGDRCLPHLTSKTPCCNYPLALPHPHTRTRAELRLRSSRTDDLVVPRRSRGESNLPAAWPWRPPDHAFRTGHVLVANARAAARPLPRAYAKSSPASSTFQGGSCRCITRPGVPDEDI